MKPYKALYICELKNGTWNTEHGTWNMNYINFVFDKRFSRLL
jgi:hypothetical protein